MIFYLALCEKMLVCINTLHLFMFYTLDFSILICWMQVEILFIIINNMICKSQSIIDMICSL